MPEVPDKDEDSPVEEGTFTSTALRGYSYNRITEELTLYFTDGHIDTWYDQKREVVEGLKNAPSKGAYFNKYIRIG